MTTNTDDQDPIFATALREVPEDMADQVRREIASLAAEVAREVTKRHDLGKQAEPELARWHAKQIHSIVKRLTNDPYMLAVARLKFLRPSRT